MLQSHVVAIVKGRNDRGEVSPSEDCAVHLNNVQSLEKWLDPQVYTNLRVKFVPPGSVVRAVKARSKRARSSAPQHGTYHLSWLLKILYFYLSFFRV